MSDIESIKSVAAANIDTVNTVAKANIDTINGVTMPNAPPGPDWHPWFDNYAWSAISGWWYTDHWGSNGWEVLLQDIEEPPADVSAIRITFTGASPLNMSLRNNDGSITYVSSGSYTSGTELSFELTDTWGRLYLDGGSFNVTNIELYYTTGG